MELFALPTDQCTFPPRGGSMKFKALIASALLLFVLGCSGQNEASDVDASSIDADANTEAAVSHENTEANTVAMTVSGKVGCGHCDYKVGSSCSAAVKTESGDIVILTGVDSDDDLFRDRMSGKEITVTGTDAGIRDGHQFVTVGSYEM